MKPWYPDELAHAGPEHLDPDFVAGYDRKQGHPDPRPDLAILTEHGALGEDATLVDLGAGTGQFALAVAQHCHRLVVVDVSAAMLDHLSARVAEAGFSNVELIHAGYLSYEHTGPAADAVYTRNALHQLPDFWKSLALERIAHVLRPGGVLRMHDLIFDFAPADAHTVLERWMDGAVEDPEVGYTRHDFATHLRTEFSTYRWLLEPMMERAGFEIIQTEFSRSIYGAYTCIKRQ